VQDIAITGAGFARYRRLSHVKQAKYLLSYSIENVKGHQQMLELSKANTRQIIRCRKLHFVGASVAQ
jgi:hypothetical protein